LVTAVQLVAPVVDAKLVPATHAGQLVCAVSGWAVPTAHSVQLVALVVFEKLPAAQSPQVRSALAVGVAVSTWPAVQLVTAVQLVCPVFAAKLVPAVQAAHDVCPASAWAEPAAHRVQLVALVAVEKLPAAQSAQVRSELAVGEAVSRRPGAQLLTGVHAVSPVVAAKSVPAVQALQLVAPVPGCTVPAAHAEQVAWPALAAK
jgi:hypothetical protein